nr:creatininase family protein [Deltaproteobacteria bacterium]
LQARHDWPVVMADHLEVGVDPCPGPGSRAIDFRTVRSLVLDSCRALHSLGAQRVVLMTFHGAPLHNLALEAGAAWLRARGVPAVAPFHGVLTQMLELVDASTYADAFSPVDDPDTRAQLMAGLREDFHAGFFETSLAMHWAPDTVSNVHERLPPCPTFAPDRTTVAAAAVAQRLGRTRLAQELRFAAVAIGWQKLRPFPGYTSSPAHANAQSGAVFARTVLDLYAPMIESVLLEGEPAPAAIMSWTRWATLHGRLGPSPQLSADDVVPAP